MNEPNDVATKWAYLAGIIDGEGCIFIGEGKGGYFCTLTVEMSSAPVPKWLHENFGGSLYNRERTHRDKIMWMWRVTGKQAALILENLVDYLVLKKEEANIFKDFVYNLQTNKSRKKLSSNEVLFRKDMIKSLKLARIKPCQMRVDQQ